MNQSQAPSDHSYRVFGVGPRRVGDIMVRPSIPVQPLVPDLSARKFKKPPKYDQVLASMPGFAKANYNLYRRFGVSDSDSAFMQSEKARQLAQAARNEVPVRLADTEKSRQKATKPSARGTYAVPDERLSDEAPIVVQERRRVPLLASTRQALGGPREEQKSVRPLEERETPKQRPPMRKAAQKALEVRPSLPPKEGSVRSSQFSRSEAYHKELAKQRRKRGRLEAGLEQNLNKSEIEELSGNEHEDPDFRSDTPSLAAQNLEPRREQQAQQPPEEGKSQQTLLQAFSQCTIDPA